jgi:hypothetical protein
VGAPDQRENEAAIAADKFYEMSYDTDMTQEILTLENSDKKVVKF